MFLKGAILICLIATGVYYVKFHYLPSSSNLHTEQNNYEFEDIDGEKLSMFSKEEIAKYVTEDKLYLVILGHVFDVTKGKNYYKKGETYHCFVGRDGTRAFVSGNFTDEGLTEDIDDISGTEAIELNNWLDFYRTNYVYEGHLIGRFFNANGSPTRHWHEFQLKLKEAEADSEEVLQEKMKYPPCNVAWSQDEGTRVWCSTKSGGIERDWTGVPRKLYQAGAESFRCACVNLDLSVGSDVINGRQGNLEAYENCDPKATSCYVSRDEEEDG
ncbi:hypothetical protein M8J77_008925 [Diaphorina citri]|nr:hypothetical protein M8J77_008925 [Diaphorina citri]